MDEWVCDCREHSFLCRSISPWVKKMWYVSRFLETASSVTGSSCFNLPCFGPSLKFVFAAQLYLRTPAWYGYLIITDNLFGPWGKKALMSKFNRLNTNTPSIRSLSMALLVSEWTELTVKCLQCLLHECLGRYTYTSDLSSDLFQAKKAIWNNWANVFIWCLRKLKINYKDSPLPAIVA